MSADNPPFVYYGFNVPVNALENQPIDMDFQINEMNAANVIHIVAHPHLEIIEQPAPKELRFRYLCEISERRAAGSLVGVHNTPERRLYPTVQVVGYVGPVVIVVSCVTTDEPFRAHPHKLVGRDCIDGICRVQVDVEDNMTKSFSNLGIQCVKRQEMQKSLELREERRIDPFRQGFSHITDASSINLNAVRLCFQAVLVNTEPYLNSRHLPPVVSDIIYDKKSVMDLVITRLSHASAPALSCQEMILLCEKVVREDIQICFYQENSRKQVVWRGTGEFTPAQVHKQFAIPFITPKYDLIPKLEKSVDVFIQLRRPSDGAVSEPLPFKFRPEEVKKRPPPTPTESSISMISEFLQLPSIKKRPPSTSTVSSSSPMPQDLQIPGTSSDVMYFWPPPKYEFQVTDPSSLPLPPISVLPNRTELPNYPSAYEGPSNEPSVLPTEQLSLGEDEQESSIPSFELFPPPARPVNPADLCALLASEYENTRMTQNNPVPSNVVPTEESNMSVSLTNLVNNTFDTEYR